MLNHAGTNCRDLCADKNQSGRLSQVTKEYLATYYDILDEMIQGMRGADLCDSISYNFISQMIPHHQAAIRMSENILRFTTSLPLQELARGIITAQTESIENMKCIQSACGNLRDSRQDLCLFQLKMEDIMQVMFHRMHWAPMTNSVNCDFMWEMIPHHQGAVEMSRNTLRYEICPDLIPILNNIITLQLRGIHQMQCLLRKMSCQRGR